MDILSLLRNSPGAQAWAQQAPTGGLAALGLSGREVLDREMSYDGSHPRQQEQAARDHFRSYGPNLLMDALIPGYGAGGDAKAASEAFGEGRYGAAALNAGMAALDFVPGLGIFAGAASKAADMAKLARAERMAGQGADRRAIWDETGWFQGADGKWRYEIDDSGASVDIRGAAQRRDSDAFSSAEILEEAARIKSRAAKRGISVNEAAASLAADLGRPVSPDALTYANTDIFSAESLVEKASRAYPIDPYAKPFALKDVLSHDEAAKAYPQIMSRPLHVGGIDGMSQFRAAYMPDEEKFFIQKYLDNDQNYSVGHEMQHAIQDAEGFAPGGNTYTTVSEAARGIEASIKDLSDRGAWDRYQAWRSGPQASRSGMSEREARAAYIAQNPDDALFKEVASLSDEMAAVQARGAADYKRLAGEVEARNVQARKPMTPAQRRATPPWETEDVPLKDQIARFLSK